MNENLPQKYRENFIIKFLKKIKKFFIKEKMEIDTNDFDINIDDNLPKTKNNTMLEDIKVDINSLKPTQYDRNMFMENLKNNPELLENFSNDRLEKILQYYLDENKKKREILKKLSV